MPTQTAHTLVTEPPVWLITGCSTGFGREIARLAVERGFRTVITAREPSSLEDFAAADNALILELDVTKPEQIASVMRAAETRFGGVDVIVNNAGIVGPQLPLHETDDANWRRVMAVNADGAFHVLRRGISALLDAGGGAVVNMASSTALSGKPNLTPYTFSKAGLAGITRSAAVEYADRGIRVNAVAPTAVMTDLVASHIANAADPVAMRELIESQTPIPGLPLPQDVAAAVAFLASADARWITGHVLPVDGGFDAC